uniref:Uncharacterized protein n=1 Tax=Anguilla anguilla TaxID=7936 RepID=A0A0E9PW78_ANGAN
MLAGWRFDFGPRPLNRDFGETWCLTNSHQQIFSIITDNLGLPQKGVIRFPIACKRCF